MSLKDILIDGGGILIIVLTFIQITPIKINPWSWLAKKLGQAINKDLTEKVKELSDKVDNLDDQFNNLDVQIKKINEEVEDLDSRFEYLDTSLISLSNQVELSESKNEERNTIISRARILRFGDEILHSVEHSKDHFEQILLDCTNYEKYCKDHPEFQNDIATATIELIKETYKICMREKSFL